MLGYGVGRMINFAGFGNLTRYDDFQHIQPDEMKNDEFNHMLYPPILLT
jgi:hypothetical protein